MAKIHRILHNGMYILPETVTDAVLDNQMQRTLTELLADKLSAVEADTAEGEITFEAGLTANGKGVVANGDGVTATKVVAPVGEIKQLIADKITTEHIESADYLGDTSGFKLANVAGDSYLEVDKLSVRKKAIFTELDIKRLDHIGGATVTSPASCRIDKVEPYTGGYKCYFMAEDGERTINNDWKIGDQAMCHAYNTTTPRYYWRLVIDKSTAIEDGYHWVTLSSSDCDADSDAPMAEDVIACFGNRTDTDRQQVIITNSEGVNSPYIQQLKGINSYNITDANVVTQLSPSKNIIRGEQIELSTASGNKGVQDLANDALGSAKEYADGVLNDAKGYADGVGSSALTNAKKYADGVGTSVTTSVKGYADGLFADSKNYTQEREEYLQSQITANANGIGLCATKTELKTVSDGVDTLATRVTEAEASIKVNADGIAALAKKTEVDITNLGTRLTTAESQISQNADAIALKASKTELTSVSDAVGGLETRMTAAESNLSVQADRISSVVSEYEGLVKQYGYSDFTIQCGWRAGVYFTNPDGTNVGSPIGYEKGTPCLLLILTDVKAGDVIRVVPNAKKQIAVVGVYGCDGDSQGAEQDAYSMIGDNVNNYTWYGRSTTLFNDYDIDVNGSIEYAMPVDSREVHIWLSDDWNDRTNIQVFHIKAKISAQSRIEQSADNIRLQVGNAGINLDNQNITLTASKTTINGDLAVSVVKCYYDEAKTQLRSAYNSNGDGTIVYYYPNGQVMRQDSFVTDTSGNVLGMRTTYYKADGSVAWVLSEGGIQTTLDYYWEALNGGNALAYTDSTTTMMDICKQYLGEAMRHFSKAQFSRFVTQNNYKDYNGKVAKGLKSGEKPDSVALYSGVLVYSIELVKDGAKPVYQVAYEQVTTKLNQLSPIMTKRFNSLGEIN